MRYFLLIFSFLMCISLNAQDTLTLSVKPDKIKIGEPVELKLELRYNAKDGKKKITWPTLKDTIIDKIEILETKKPKIKPDPNGDEFLIQEKILSITSFDSGYYAIPPMQVMINDDTLYSNPVLVEVHTVAVDTTKEIKSIKGIYETELSWDDFWYSVKTWFQKYWWVVAILIILPVLLYFILRKKKSPEVKTPVITVLPHDLALKKIEILAEKKLWQNGYLKEYHVELTDILREYIEARFRIRAKEQTTDEIMTQLRLTDISEVSKITLVPVLRLADLVKFAKENPIGVENEEVMQRAIDFIMSTIPKINPTEK